MTILPENISALKNAQSKQGNIINTFTSYTYI